MQAVHTNPSLPISNFILFQKTARFPEILGAGADRDVSLGSGEEPEIEIQSVTEALLSWQLPAVCIMRF